MIFAAAKDYIIAIIIASGMIRVSSRSMFRMRCAPLCTTTINRNNRCRKVYFPIFSPCLVHVVNVLLRSALRPIIAAGIDTRCMRGSRVFTSSPCFVCRVLHSVLRNQSVPCWPAPWTHRLTRRPWLNGSNIGRRVALASTMDATRRLSEWFVRRFGLAVRR